MVTVLLYVWMKPLTWANVKRNANKIEPARRPTMVRPQYKIDNGESEKKWIYHLLFLVQNARVYSVTKMLKNDQPLYCVQLCPINSTIKGANVFQVCPFVGQWRINHNIFGFVHSSRPVVIVCTDLLKRSLFGSL